MFLPDLSTAQRRAFLVLARRVIDADRRLALQEVERLDRLYAEAGMPAETADAPAGAGDLNLLFPDRRSRVAVLLELLIVAYADDRLDPREMAAIRDVAAHLGVDAGTWEDVRDWGERHHALVQEARRIADALPVGG